MYNIQSGCSLMNRCCLLFVENLLSFTSKIVHLYEAKITTNDKIEFHTFPNYSQVNIPNLLPGDNFCSAYPSTSKWNNPNILLDDKFCFAYSKTYQI